MSSPDFVSETEQKIKFLAKHWIPMEVLGHRQGVDPMCQKLGIKRQSLEACYEDNRISSNLQSTLAKGLKFSRNWNEWTSGTALQFEEKYLREHQIASKARETNVRVAAGPRQKATKSKIEGLASVEIQGHQFGLGTASIELSISCGKPEVVGKRVTIKSGRVELQCHPALLSKESHQRWMTADGKTVGNKGTVIIAFEAGTRDAPSWRLTADGPSIGNIELDPDFATLEGLSPGDEITIVLGTWLSDIDETDDVDSDAISVGDTDDSMISKPEEHLSLVKRRVIASLRKKLLAADGSGYVELARHTLRIVEAVVA